MRVEDTTEIRTCQDGKGNVQNRVSPKVGSGAGMRNSKSVM